MLFNRLVTGHIFDANPARTVRGPKHLVKKGKAPDRALIATALTMKWENNFPRPVNCAASNSSPRYSSTAKGLAKQVSLP